MKCGTFEESCNGWIYAGQNWLKSKKYADNKENIEDTTVFKQGILELSNTLSIQNYFVL